MGVHPNRKDYTKEQILNALKATHSIPAAARYLGCSYSHLRGWMKHYDSTTHSSMLAEFGNRGGKGIPKFKSAESNYKLIDILEGRIDITNFKIPVIKYRLCEEGYLEEKCSDCGFQERRIVDYKMPLILRFKDKNKRNWKLENLALSCYNCYFLFYGKPLNEYDIKSLESHQSFSKTTDAIDMEMDEWRKELYKDLGDEFKGEEEKEYNIVAYKNPKDGKK